MASVLKLSDISGLNKRSAINQTNLPLEGDFKEELELVPAELKNLYASFWTNLPYLTNPLNLLSIKKEEPGQT